MYVFSVAALQLHYVTEDRLAVESRAKAVFEVGLTVKEEYLYREYLYRVFKAGLIVKTLLCVFLHHHLLKLKRQFP